MWASRASWPSALAKVWRVARATASSAAASPRAARCSVSSSRAGSANVAVGSGASVTG